MGIEEGVGEMGINMGEPKRGIKEGQRKEDPIAPGEKGMVMMGQEILPRCPGAKPSAFLGVMWRARPFTTLW